MYWTWASFSYSEALQTSWDSYFSLVFDYSSREVAPCAFSEVSSLSSMTTLLAYSDSFSTSGADWFSLVYDSCLSVVKAGVSSIFSLMIIGLSVKKYSEVRLLSELSKSQADKGYLKI